MRRAAVAAVALAAAAPGSVMLAQGDAPGGWVTELRGGTCAQPGDVAALLEAVPVRESVAQDPSVEQDRAVATSVTNVTMPLAEFTAAPHVIVVQAPDGDGAAICGEVGGPVVEDQGLAFSLAAADGELAGMAWLRELGLDATTVHVFVVADGSAPVDGAPEPGASPTPSPEPSASPEAGEGLDAGEEIDPREDIDVDVGE